MALASPVWQSLLSGQRHGEPGPEGHFVQLYGADERALARNVARYLWDGLKLGEGLLVIATSEHSEAIERELTALGGDSHAAVQRNQLVFRDAKDLLASFMLDGQPDWSCFEKNVGAAIETLRAGRDHTGLRAYGEMVGVLWSAGQVQSAIRVEEFWNRLLKSNDMKLFCSYPIDLFGEEAHGAAVDGILCAHTHLLPVGENGDLERALNRAMEEILAPEVNAPARIAIKTHSHPAWPSMPTAEADLLSFRRIYSEFAGEVLARAREHYENEKRFRTLLENSFDAISLTDEQGKVLYASGSTARVLGYEPEEIRGRSWFELAHPDDLLEVRQRLAEVLAKPHVPVQLEFRTGHKNGHWCWIESTTTNLLDEPEIRAIVSNYRDISERKATDEEKQRHAEKLARSNEDLQAFAYAAAHDLKEPLRTISACTQLLSRSAGLDENSRKLAGFVVESAKRMSTLLDDLLSFAGLSASARLDRVELNKTLDQALKNLKESIDESAATITLTALPTVLGNESHLVELFQNLIGNAIKYRSDAAIEINISAERSGREWIVKVKDNGIGIAPEYHAQIFGLLKRLHGREVPGTGIGLAICKKIVEVMGGRIWVESEPGKGSVFCFTVTE